MVSLSAWVYDIADSAWARSHEIIKRLVREFAPDIQLALTRHQTEELVQQEIIETISPRHVGRLSAGTDLKLHQSGYWLNPPRSHLFFYLK
jgi:hypothetical protein